MPGLISPDVMQATVDVRTARAAGAPPTRREQIQTKLQQEGPRPTLESLSSRVSSQDKMNQLNEQNIGTKINETTGKRDMSGATPEDAAARARLTRAKDAQTLLTDYLEKGIDGLTLAPRTPDTVRQNKILGFIEKAVETWPEGRNLLAGVTTAAEKRDILMELARHPAIRDKVRLGLEGILANDSLAQDQVTPKRNEYDSRRVIEQQKAEEIAENNRRKIENDAKLAEFSPATRGIAAGAKYTELDTLKANEPALQRDKVVLTRNIEGQNKLIQALNQERAYAVRRGAATNVIDANLLNETGELHRLQDELSDVDVQLTRKTNLETEQGQLEQQRTDIAEEKARLERELEPLKRDRLRVHAELNTAELNRSTGEELWVSSLEQAFTKAAQEFLDEKITASEAADRILTEEEKAKAGPEEKAMNDCLDKRWDKPKGRGRKQTIDYDKAQIEEDYGVLMTQGPRAVMRSILIAGGIDPADADVKLDDPAFMEKCQAKVVQRLLTRRIQTGKITPNEARKIIESDWGKGMVDKAIQSRKEIKDAIENLRKNGVLNEGFPGGLWSALKNASDGSVLKFLLIILTVGGLGAMFLKSALSQP